MKMKGWGGCCQAQWDQRVFTKNGSCHVWNVTTSNVQQIKLDIVYITDLILLSTSNNLIKDEPFLPLDVKILLFSNSGRHLLFGVDSRSTRIALGSTRPRNQDHLLFGYEISQDVFQRKLLFTDSWSFPIVQLHSLIRCCHTRFRVAASSFAVHLIPHFEVRIYCSLTGTFDGSQPTMKCRCYNLNPRTTQIGSQCGSQGQVFSRGASSTLSLDRYCCLKDRFPLQNEVCEINDCSK